MKLYSLYISPEHCENCPRHVPLCSMGQLSWWFHGIHCFCPSPVLVYSDDYHSYNSWCKKCGVDTSQGVTIDLPSRCHHSCFWCSPIFWMKSHMPSIKCSDVCNKYTSFQCCWFRHSSLLKILVKVLCEISLFIFH